MIEVLEKLQTVGGGGGFYKTPVQYIISGNKHLPQVGATYFRNLNIMIMHNIIHNCPVTVEHIEIAEKIFGSNVSTLKGTTMRQRPKVVVEKFIEIPIKLVDNNQGLILCMDIISINKQELFKTIEKDIRFLVLVPLSNITK